MEFFSKSFSFFEEETMEFLSPEEERERSRVSRAWLAIRRFLFLHLFWQCSHSLVLLSASQPVPSPSLSLPLLSRPSYPAFARFHSFLLQFPPLFLLS